MEETIIRKGKKEDLPEVLALIRELALFEKAPEQVTNTLAAMESDGFSNHPVFGFHVATLNGKVVGMALYFIKYSTWKGKGLYLDDLVVTEQHRGKGIGTQLFNAYIAEARKVNANQVHWQVLDWNTPAISLYKKIGASLETEWLDCKLNREQLLAYCEQNNIL
jgi:GNAT superfamily N-acetyltransferase